MCQGGDFTRGDGRFEIVSGGGGRVWGNRVSARVRVRQCVSVRGIGGACMCLRDSICTGQADAWHGGEEDDDGS